MAGCRVRWLEGWTDEWIDGWSDENIIGRTKGWMYGLIVDGMRDR